MAPIAELPGQRPAPTESTVSSFTDFPPWTRGDESENEAEDDDAKRSLASFRGRGRRRCDASMSPLERDNDDDTSRSSAHSIFKRGISTDFLEPVVNNLVGAAKGSDPDDKGPTSDDSGHETDHASPSPYKSPPPETSRIVGSPTSPPPPPPPPPSQQPQIPTGVKATSAPGAGPSSPTGGRTPKQPPPVNNANSKFSPSTPLYEVTKCSSITSSTVIPESTTSVLLTVATPTPTGRSLISLTPIITGPITVLSSGARKGVGVLPTEVPVVFVMQPSLSTSTATSYYSYETAESDEMKENHPHPYDDPHANTEKALIAVGSVGATIITFFVFWLAWKCFKRQGRKHGFRNWKPSLSASPLLDKPKQLMMDLASRVPVLKKRLTKRSWTNIDKPYDHAVWEKKLPAPDARLENPRGITVHTAITTRSENEEPRHASARGNVPNHSSTIQPQFNQTLPSNYQVPYNRMSDISSLSSGFGDGDITFPPANSNATTINTTYLVVPAPVAQRSSVSDTSQRRDTMYTEASEDSVPRFRSINSWVRQQTGWVKRAKQDEMVASNAPPVPSMPPEQEFRLMMPDGEEPRRVDVTMGSSGMALHVEFER